mgnify:FL=1
MSKVEKALAVIRQAMIDDGPSELWYLNIPPEGVECYVSVRTPNPSCSTRIIFFYNSGYRLPFRSSHLIGWKYATPVHGRIL